MPKTLEKTFTDMTAIIEKFLNDKRKTKTLLDTTIYGFKAFSEMLEEFPKLKESLTQSPTTNKSIKTLDQLSEINDKNYMTVVPAFHSLVHDTADILGFKPKTVCPEGLTWPYAQSDECINKLRELENKIHGFLIGLEK
ncbi:MAG: hypothetical protein J6K87_03285 [Clostridia bacterium]|nr:hypothetical protein [Clostridia bacterium]